MVSSLSHMCHTFCSSSVVRMELNGKEIGEIGIAARIGGYFGVPTLLVSGDEAACREARNELGKHVLTVPTKQAWGRYTAVNYPLEKVYRDLRNQAKKALSLLEDIPLPHLSVFDPAWILKLTSLPLVVDADIGRSLHFTDPGFEFILTELFD